MKLFDENRRWNPEANKLQFELEEKLKPIFEDLKAKGASRDQALYMIINAWTMIELIDAA